MQYTENCFKLVWMQTGQSGRVPVIMRELGRVGREESVVNMTTPGVTMETSVF